MEGGDQSSLELGEVEVKISKFALHSSTPSALIIQNSMKSVRIKAGEEFSLICEVHGRPTPNILWYKNNLQIKRQWFHYSFVNYGIRIINSGTSELRYQSVTSNDSGNYTCHAQNVYGHVQKSINIEVQYLTTTELLSSHTTTISKKITDGPISLFENNYLIDKPCLNDHDCLSNPCKANNSVGKRVSYKTCVCPVKNNTPKCELSQFRNDPVFSNNEQIEQNSFKTCKDGCDPNTSRLFLLSVLSLLLFLLIVFLIMVFITKRQRSRYKLTYSSRKVKTNSNKENQRCLLIDKRMSLLDSTSNPSPSFSWEMTNSPIYTDNGKYFTIQSTIKPNDSFCYLENTNQIKFNFDNQIEKSQKSSLLTKMKTKPILQNLDLTNEVPLTFQNKNDRRISQSIVLKSLNSQHEMSKDSFSSNSLNEIL